VLKREFLVPKPGARDQLVSRVAEALASVANADWGSLQTAKLSDPLRATVRARARNFVVTVMLGGLPIGFLLGLKALGYHLPGQLDNLATALAGLWAAVSVLFSLDPKFEAKIATMKQLSELGTGGGIGGRRSG
jgi:hypothetical protein